MSRFCPAKNGPALYLECMECDDKVCEKELEMISEEAQIAMYGACSRCGHPMHPICFIETNEKDESKIKMSVSHLECSICGTKETVDDSFDQRKWYPNTEVVRTEIENMISYYLSRMN